jgi:outer membrane biosynthesis protein TonB
MKIILETKEIQAALEAYVSTNIPMVQGMDFSVDFSGSAAKGFEAALTVSAKGAETATRTEAPVKPKPALKAVTKAKEEPVAEEPAPGPVPEPEVEEESQIDTPETPQPEEKAEETVAEPAGKKAGGAVFKFNKKA